MSLARASGRLLSSTLERVESDWCRRLGGFRHQGGVQDPFLVSSSPVTLSSTPPQLFPVFHQGDGVGQRNHNPSGERGNQASPQFSRILQPGICGSEGFRRLASDHRFIYAQQTCGVHSVPHGVSSIGVAVGSDRGLYGFGGLERRLPSDSHPSRISTVPQIRVVHRDCPVQGSMFRADHSTTGFYQSHGPSVQLDAPSGFSHVALPGRLADIRFNKRGSYQSERQAFTIMSDVRDKSQSIQIPSRTDSEYNLLGNENQCRNFEGFPNPREDIQAAITAKRISVLTKSSSQTVEEPIREDVLNVPDCSRVPTEDAVLTAASEQSVGLRGRGVSNLVGCELPSGSSVVVRRRQSDPRGTTEDPLSRFLSFYGCVRPRLGRIIIRRQGIGSLVSSREAKFNQLERVESDSSGDTIVPSNTSELSSGIVLRQCHIGGLLEESRGHEVVFSECGGSSNSSPLRTSTDISSSSIYPGPSQRHCRWPKPLQPSPGSKVVSLQGGIPSDPSLVASNSGPICYQTEPSTNGLLFSGSRSHLK